MTKCLICNSTEFEVNFGARVCIECGAHEINFLELEHEEGNGAWEADPRRYAQFNIFMQDSKSNFEEPAKKWASAEVMNIILLDWIKALMHIGATEKFKQMALSLWALYLKKRKIAFGNILAEETADLQTDIQEVLPSRDVEAIRNTKVPQSEVKQKSVKRVSELDKVKRKVGRKKIRSSDASCYTSFLANELSRTLNSSGIQEILEEEVDASEDKSYFERINLSCRLPSPDLNEEVENVENTVSRPCSPEEIPENSSILEFEAERQNFKKTFGSFHACNERFHLNPNYSSIDKLIALLYLAILLTEENLLLSDLLRWCKEDHVPYFTAVHLLNNDFTISRSQYKSFFKQFSLDSREVCESAGMLAQFISIQALPLPSFKKVLDKFSKALNIPNDVSFRALNTAEMFFMDSHIRFRIPSVETYCAACILLTIKIACGLDDQQEYLLSEFAEKVNKIMKKNGSVYRLFSWGKWQSYINRLQWWLKEVNISQRHFFDNSTSIDTQRLLKYFWTQGIWKTHLNSEATLDSWQNNLAEYLLHIDNLNIGKLMGQAPLFKPNSVPYSGHVKQYIEEAFSRDASRNKKKFLKIAQQLDSTNFSDHRTYWFKEDIVLNFKEVNKDVQVKFVSLKNKKKIFTLLHKEKQNLNGSSAYFFVPHPKKMFWTYSSKSIRPENSFTFQQSNFIWLVKQLSELCESHHQDILNQYGFLESKYLNYCGGK